MFRGCKHLFISFPAAVGRNAKESLLFLIIKSASSISNISFYINCILLAILSVHSFYCGDIPPSFSNYYVEAVISCALCVWGVCEENYHNLTLPEDPLSYKGTTYYCHHHHLPPLHHHMHTSFTHLYYFTTLLFFLYFLLYIYIYNFAWTPLHSLPATTLLHNAAAYALHHGQARRATPHLFLPHCML